MPLLYAQVKECRDRCFITHFIVDIQTLSRLTLFCNDNLEVSRITHVPVQELVTFAPIYDSIMSGGCFCDSIEFLEEEFYNGRLTNGIAKWLLMITKQSRILLPGQFGMNLPKHDLDESPCKMEEVLSLLVKSSHALHVEVEGEDTTSKIGSAPCTTCTRSFLFRSIFLKFSKGRRSSEGDVMLFERIESYVGQSPEHARMAACKNGFMGAMLDMKYIFHDDIVVFIGIESFAELPCISDYPMVLARQTLEWPWKYDVGEFKKELLAETLEVNRLRRKERLRPFW